MKAINKKKIIDVMISLFTMAFLVLGWVLFIMSEINKDKTITDEINKQTLNLHKQMNAARDSVIRHETVSVDISTYESYIDELIKKNYSLQDSLEYYSAFYDIIKEGFSFNYTVQKKIQDGRQVCRYTLKDIRRKENNSSEENTTESISDSVR